MKDRGRAREAAGPERARARRLPPAERREQLLGCAVRVFARRGLGDARHAAVAEEAGVSVSTVFVYFPTRSALVEAVLEEVERFLVALVARTQAPEVSAPRAVLAATRAFAESIDTHPDHALVWLDWSTAIRRPVWPRYLAFQERVVGLIEETLRRGQEEGSVPADVDAEAEARLVVGSAHMIAQMKLTKVPEERLERFLRALVRAVLVEGDAPRPGAPARARGGAPA